MRMAGSTSFSSTGPCSRAFRVAARRPHTSIETSATALFEDVTAKAGLTQSGWGQGSCVGDYDNDGHDDLFVTYWGQNRLYHNRGDGTFDEVSAAVGLATAKPRWGAGCAFLDYDRDGRLDLFAANYIDFDLASAPVPESGLCRYKGIPVACGPPGLTGGKNVLYRNTGKGRFEDVSERAGITRASGTYGLGVSTLDFNDDGWVDLYVANDSNPSALYLNNKDGTFTDTAVLAGCAYSQDGKPQAGMGVAIGDYNRDGTVDIFKTNFAGDTSTLYANDGKGFCDDRTFAGGIGINTRWLGWGVGFLDLDNDGWLDLFLVNGHVYPEVERLKTEAGYKQRKVVYRESAQWTIPGRHRTAWPAGDDAQSRPGCGVRRSRQRRRSRHRRQQCSRHAGSLHARFSGRCALADREAGGHALEPQRHWRARASGHGGRPAGAGGAWRRQLLFAERSAGPFRDREDDTHRAAGDPLAQRPRGEVDGSRGRSDHHAEGGQRRRRAALRNDVLPLLVARGRHVARACPDGGAACRRTGHRAARRSSSRRDC